MSQWRGADYPKQFYGHEFLVDDETVKKLQPIKIPQIRKSKYTRFRGQARFRNKIRKIPKQLNKSVDKSIDDLWDLLKTHDVVVQKRHAHVYAGSNGHSFKKRTPGVGIEDSIRVQERNLNNLKIGQWKYHTYFLIHGNTMGEETFLIHWWSSGMYHSELVHGIRPKHGKVLATRPTGTFVAPRRWVRSYSSRYNYLEQSFREMESYVRSNCSWVMMKIHIH